MRFSSGFIMLPRDLRQTYFMGNSLGHDLLVYIISNAEWDPTKSSTFKKGKNCYEVGFGEYVAPIGLIAQYLGVKRDKIVEQLSYLKKIKLVERKSLYNCSKFKVNSDFMVSISKAEQNHNNNTSAPNEDTRHKNKYKNNPKGLQKETRLTPPSKSHDEEGTPNMFENSPDKKKSKRPRKAKNIPPVDLNTPVGTLALSDIKNAWNEHCGDLPKLRGFNEKRLKKVQRCWDELGLSDLTLFSKAVSNLSKSNWALSERHDFDWLINSSSTLERAFNGYYNKDFSKKSNKTYDPAKDPGTREYFADEIAEQAKIMRENPNWKTEFTPAQLAEMDNPDF